ncbi:transmembrane protein 205-like [Stylophora pistillata]|uniref:transmembrane protein 205-like n=1 Tax=Stylophora pistillata TaxID=50429 RepID=UPI000C042196|nr:transmembrane protein 205-like [Stylophora pistillata]
MTIQMSFNLLGLALLCVIVSMSSRISEEIQKGVLLTTTVRLLHLISFGTWFGMQFWVTFIAGYKMYFTLTRHTFGNLQSQLFPVYFTVGSCLSTVALATYYLMHPVQMWTGDEKLQVSGLAVSMLATLINKFFLEPKTTAMMLKRYAYEKEHGYGDDIGPIKDKAFKTDETYLRMTHEFSMAHGFTAMTNILAYTGSILHVWLLAKNEVLVI